MIEKVERWEKGGGQGKEGVEEGQVKEWRLRLRKMEVKQDRKDREGRRNNIVIRGLGWEGWGSGGGGEEALGEDGAGRGGCEGGSKDRKSGRGGSRNGAGEAGRKGGEEESDGGEEKVERREGED